jgi:hypothetical protein
MRRIAKGALRRNTPKHKVGDFFLVTEGENKGKFYLCTKVVAEDPRDIETKLAQLEIKDLSALTHFVRDDSW